MCLLKKLATVFFLTSLISLPAQAALTLYTTGWSMYSQMPYEYDGAYKNHQAYGQLSYVSNPDMVAQFNQADVVVWSFLQVWNSQDPAIAQYHIPQAWDGLMHFDDLWGELPLEGSWINPLPPETNDFLNFCRANAGTCASVQLNGNTGAKELFNYTDQKGVGQLNSFGAFIHSSKYTAKRIIAIGGANTPTNKGVSTATYDAIFAHQDKFLRQFKAWMDHFHNLNGVDYDFEPPIDVQSGAQLPPSEKTLADYKSLYNLVKASRETLGPDAYISVTITVNQEYLQMINQSVDGGWFKEVAGFVDSVNLMTYDLHGPWSQSSDPFTAIHAYVKQPKTPHKDEFAINYAMDTVTEQVLSYGMPKDKLQVGIAAYGRGFAGVEAGADSVHPGLDQVWTGPSQVPSAYSDQEGFLPYASVDRLVKDLNYSIYLVDALDENQQPFVSAAYLYHPSTKQFIGYQSPEVVRSICAFVKAKQLKGSILWSADTDLPVSNPQSLVSTYHNACP